MDTVKVLGEMKIVSAMDLNSFTLHNKEGRHIGHLILTDTEILDSLDTLFLKTAIATGEIKPTETQVKGGMKLGISFYFISNE